MRHKTIDKSPSFFGFCPLSLYGEIIDCAKRIALSEYLLC